MGVKIAYVQGNCPTSNWDVLKVLTYAEYLDSKGEYEIIETYKETKGEVTNMVKLCRRSWYVAIDGKKFKTKKEAFLHEKSLKTTYVYLSYEPIDGQLGKFDTNVIMKVIGDRNFAEDLVRDFRHREFGQQLYENDEEQLVRNWFISGTSTEESYLKSNSKRGNFSND